jgi:hypothetical protein
MYVQYFLFKVPVTLIISSLTALILYPKPGKCPCIVDGVSAMGALVGAFVASWYSYRWNLKVIDNTIYTVFIRLFVGLSIVGTWRILGKKFLLAIFRSLPKFKFGMYVSCFSLIYVRLDTDYMIRYIMYFGIGFLAVSIPIVFGVVL